ncbi:UbiA family prenyltransferase [Micromonospora tarensis]|uniref:UbiA family prenyltransferase n=1 Tax=Micromonospora tarensis TaxID=2806100 RepID=A0ABS1YNH3_9ACTN|nr:UbiA family prenyltransferase [Micromonospora tarensis]MBM0278974.1 UbiA family prenyltransferase [Micromonospora tarensis]
MNEELVGYLKLVRPSPVAANAVQVLMGAYLGGGGAALMHRSVVAAATSMALVTTVANVVNDVCDVRADRLNRPERPLVTGVVSPRAASWFASGAAAGAVALAPSGTARGLIVAIMVLSVGYSFGVKRLPLVANGYVAVLAGTPVVLGAVVAGGELRSAAVAAVVLIVFMFSYEVLKTLRDIEGDRHAGFSTVATEWGARVTTRIYRLTVGVFAIVAALPLVVTPAGLSYLLLVVGGAVLPSVAIAARMDSTPTPPTIRRALHILVICWLPGLLGLEDLR